MIEKSKSLKEMLMLSDEEMRQEKKLTDLILVLKEKPLSITQLSNKVNINRSTIRYYLSLLLQKKWVYVERKKEMSGRPVIISVNKKYFEKEHTEHKKKVKKILDVYLKSPYTKKILEVLFEKEKMSLNEILQETKEIDPHGLYISNTISHLAYMKNSFNFVNEFYELSEAGKNVLEKNEN